MIKEAQNNAYQLFHEKTSSRRDYLQREMKNKWTNFEPYVANISKLLHGSQHEFNSSLFFDEAIQELISMIRTTQVTGAYIILDSDKNSKNELPALYLRDYDPIMNPYNYEDIYMVYGPSQLAKSLKIPLDQTWRYNLKVTDKNSDFIRKPCDKTSITSKANYLGYWSKPFKLQAEDVTIVTYSRPLFDNVGVLRGIVGIEITLSHLDKYFPATELQPQDSLGYLIAYSDDDGKHLTPIIMGGALQRRMIDNDKPLDLDIVDRDKNIFTINNHYGKEQLFASVEKLNLYQYNTPFEEEHWYLVGIMGEDYLLSYANRIKQILWVSLIIALILGGIGASFISLRITKPIVKLASQVNDSNQLRALNLEPTGFHELDELSKAIELANKRTLESASRLAKIVELFELPIGAYEINHETNSVFVTNNFYSIINWLADNKLEIDALSFRSIMNNVLSKPLKDESNVYDIGCEVNKWIRFKETNQENITIGVVLDVTDEILEKKQIMRERDHDPLTMLLNRKSFQSSFEIWYKNYAFDKQAGLIMFDLDNLKFINDTYGHKWGDSYILTAVANLKKIAGEANVLLGRRSGDEFILLLHGFESKDEIRKCMDGFYQKLEIECMVLPDGNNVPAMLSAGIMWIDGRSFTYDELLHFADEALYEAKRNHKGYYMENNQVNFC